MKSTNNIRSYIPWLDGMKGFCALYVVIHHAIWEVVYKTSPNQIFNKWGLIAKIFQYGHFMVTGFIIISGFSIFQILDSQKKLALRGGHKEYIKRRLRRILPPYYFCIALYYLLVFFIPKLQIVSGSRWDDALPMFTKKIFLTHLFFVHFIDDQIIAKINPPMWSIAIEEWIYWLVPIFVLPIWRKFKSIAGLSAAFAVGYALYINHIATYNACTWYFGLFAFGMWLAENQLKFKKIKLTTIKLMNGLSVLLLVYACQYSDLNESVSYLLDCIVGVSIVLMIITVIHGFSVFKFIFESEILKRIGKFSYSLYLVHYIIISLVFFYIKTITNNLHLQMYLSMVLGVPAAILISYIFYRFFEKPFMK